jgi:hypothetical protein
MPFSCNVVNAKPGALLINRILTFRVTNASQRYERILNFALTLEFSIHIQQEEKQCLTIVSDYW